jgi:hypothetical protein
MRLSIGLDLNQCALHSFARFLNNKRKMSSPDLGVFW